MRGINTVQLVMSTNGWKIQSIFWMQETPEHPTRPMTSREQALVRVQAKIQTQTKEEGGFPTHKGGKVTKFYGHRWPLIHQRWL